MGGLAWSGAQGQNGFIPFYALPMIHATKREAGDLVDVVLWLPTQGGLGDQRLERTPAFNRGARSEIKTSANGGTKPLEREGQA